MAGGCAAALRDAEVVAGLTGGPLGASFCALLLWSGRGAQEVLVDWTPRRQPAELEDFANEVENVPRIVARRRHRDRRGAAGLRDAAGARCPRRRPAGDRHGRRRPLQRRRPPGPIRDRLVAAGVTINGLCVLHEEPDLVRQLYARGDRRPGRVRAAVPGLFRVRRGDAAEAGAGDRVGENVAKPERFGRADALTSRGARF